MFPHLHAPMNPDATPFVPPASPSPTDETHGGGASSMTRAARDVPGETKRVVKKVKTLPAQRKSKSHTSSSTTTRQCGKKTRCSNRTRAFWTQCEECFTTRCAREKGGVNGIIAKATRALERETRLGEEDLISSLKWLRTIGVRFDPKKAMESMVEAGLLDGFKFCYDAWTKRTTDADNVFYPRAAFNAVCAGSLPINWEPFFDFIRSLLVHGDKLLVECLFTSAHVRDESRDMYDYSDVYRYQTYSEDYLNHRIYGRASALEYLWKRKCATFTEAHMQIAVRNKDVTGVAFLRDKVGLPFFIDAVEDHLVESVRGLNVDWFELVATFAIATPQCNFTTMKLKQVFIETLGHADEVRYGLLNDDDLDTIDDFVDFLCGLPDDSNREDRTHLRAISDLFDEHKETIPDGKYLGVMRYVQHLYNQLGDRDGGETELRLAVEQILESGREDFHHAFHRVLFVGV